jgi:hypothetical protein
LSATTREEAEARAAELNETAEAERWLAVEVAGEWQAASVSGAALPRSCSSDGSSTEPPLALNEPLDPRSLDTKLLGRE